MTKTRYLLLLLSVFTLVLLSACGASAGSTKDKVTKVIVGTGTQFPNVCFIDKDGKLTGYDVELVREIDKRLSNYDFEFKTMDFSNLVVSLGANKIDMIAHEMEVNDERKEKFTFNKVPYNYFPNQITVLKDNKDINNIADLKGKTVITSATSNGAALINKINKDNGDQFKVVYAGQGSNDVAKQLESGRADATVSTPFAVKFQNESSPIKEKVVGDVLSDSKVYFMFDKKDKTLNKEVDKALKEIIDDGTLKKLSEKWLGGDYSKSSFGS